MCIEIIASYNIRRILWIHSIILPSKWEQIIVNIIKISEIRTCLVGSLCCSYNALAAFADSLTVNGTNYEIIMFAFFQARNFKRMLRSLHDCSLTQFKSMCTVFHFPALSRTNLFPIKSN